MPVLHDPVAIHLFGLAIRWYAIFILAGICAGVWTATLLARRRGQDPEFILEIAPWVVLAAIVGARLYWVLLQFRELWDHPGEMINIRLGGLTIHGALAAGIATFAWFCWRRRQPFWLWADIVIAAVPIGQAIGRWGNWANQEAFGTPTNLPWAVHIDPQNRPLKYAQYSSFQPTFLYECLLDLAIAAVLIWIVLHASRLAWYATGDALAIYCVLYGIGRFLIESDRTDSLYIGPLPAAYWLSGALVLIGGALLAWRHLFKFDLRSRAVVS